MAKFNTLQNNFKSGKLSPLLDGRTDLAEYVTGLKELKNFRPLRQGGVKKREGTEFVLDMSLTFSNLDAAPISYPVYNADQSKYLFITNNSDAVIFNWQTGREQTDDDVSREFLKTGLFDRQNSYFPTWEKAAPHSTQHVQYGNEVYFAYDAGLGSNAVEPMVLYRVKSEEFKASITFYWGTRSATIEADVAGETANDVQITFDGSSNLTTIIANYNSSVYTVTENGQNTDAVDKFFVSTGHGFTTGQKIVCEFTSSIFDDGGIASGQAFYIIYIDNNNFSLTSTYEDALAGTNKIPLKDNDGSNVDFILAKRVNLKTGTGTDVVPNTGVYPNVSAGVVKLQDGKEANRIFRFNTIKRFTQDGRNERTASVFNREHAICVPYLPENSDQDNKINVPASAVGIQTLTSQKDTFTADQVGSYLKINETTTRSILWEIVDFVNSKEIVARKIAIPTGTVAGNYAEWQESAWSKRRGYPRAITVYEGRLSLAGSSTLGGKVWFTAVDDIPVFMKNVLRQDKTSDVSQLGYYGESASNANEIGYADSVFKQIVFMREGRQLEIATNGDIKVLNTGDGIGTDSIPSFSVESERGASVGPFAVRDDSTLFFDTKGELSRLNLDPRRTDASVYIAERLSLLVEGLNLGTPIFFNHYNDYRNTMFFTLSKPNINTTYSVTFEDYDKSVAWAEQDYGGTVVSMSSFDDESYMQIIVRRTNGVFLERINQRDANLYSEPYLDSNKYIFDIAGSATISGLDHLEGETVGIRANPFGTNIYYERVVSGGSVTIPETAGGIDQINDAFVGLPYTAELETMRIDAGLNIEGSSQGQIKRLDRAKIRVVDSKNFSAGDPQNLYPVKFDNVDFFTGDKEVFLDQGPSSDVTDDQYKVENRVKIVSDGPDPLTVLGIITRGITYE